MARALKLLPYAVLLLIPMVRIWDPALVQQIRNLTFDAYQRELPRSWNLAVPVRIVDIGAASRTRLAPPLGHATACGDNPKRTIL